MYRFALILILLTIALPVSAQPLVSVEWLEQNKNKPDLVLLDLQSNQNYLRFHIPGSVNTEYSHWRTEKKGQPKVLPPVPIMEKLIGSLGISNKSHVVLIPLGASAGDVAVASRVYWSFKVLGHDKVSILDGGLIAYAETRKYPLEKGNHQLKPATFKANYRAEMNPDAEAVKQAISSGALAVDNRTRAEFLGIYKGGAKERPGSLPGAVNLNYDWLTVNGSGKLHKLENLKQIYTAGNVPLQGAQINYCHTGNRAALAWFVSHELLGNSQAKLYDGSTQEWAADSTLPMDRQVQLNF
ncbi:MAG: sulfurtransferase [gamma proteobacterium symbiont of Stewartia floridana]|nr:MAG: sulfurtransferase [gamma proteobacterium symbiont of Stewartia floridana]